jgi:predicted glycogen debranching enzyme
VEAYRGLDALDDNLYAGLFEVTLQPGESVTIVASTEANPSLDGFAAYAEQQDHERLLLESARSCLASMPPAVEQLVLAADQFVVCRGLNDGVPGALEGRSVIAGYHWFSDWGRDTMISLPGLTLATGRREVAARILWTFAQFVDRGMLPNRFPDAGEEPEYNTVDATLWYFEAIRAYHAATGDVGLVRELFPVLEEIVEWHRRGTRYQIRVDGADGLLFAGEPGVQLTWMDAKVDDWVVTPRIGKPVEINALWYNALRIMADFARHLGEAPEPYDELAELAGASFGRFWI